MGLIILEYFSFCIRLFNDWERIPQQITNLILFVLQTSVKILNAAENTAQLYDRDNDPAMAKEGMKGFQEFMVHPDRLDDSLNV